jgi:hypothetical protein
VARAKHVSIGASLLYGWRLTRRHFRTLVPGSVLFYLPELAQRLGWDAGAWSMGVTAWHSIVACGLLWHALQLSDQETRRSRLHEGSLPAPGYLGRFVSSTGLYWSVLLLGSWPAMRLATGQWWPADRSAALAWLWRPWLWTPAQAWLALQCAAAAVPAGIWTVYGWFHGYYVADEGQNAWPSMVSSYQAVHGAFWRTLVFLGVIGAVNWAGYSLWVVGVFAAFPVTLMATTYIHLELKEQSDRDLRGVGR